MASYFSVIDGSLRRSWQDKQAVRIAGIALATLVLLAGLYKLSLVHNPLNADLPLSKNPAPVQSFAKDRVAVIVEHRPLMVLIPVLALFLRQVPQNWPFMIWSGPDNYELLTKSRVLQPHIESGKLTIQNLPPDRMINSPSELSTLLTGDWFWEQHDPYEHILFFQADSVLCSNSNQTVDDFLGLDVFPGGYQWIGAVWGAGRFSPEPIEGRWGGNGGLSIRRRSAMLKNAKSNRWPGMVEDYFHVKSIQQEENYLPSLDTALRFSFEYPPPSYHDSKAFPFVFRPLGAHAGSDWPACGDKLIMPLLDWCPELKMVISLDCIP